MKLGYLVVAVLAVTITVFALQNTTQTAIRFAFWRLDGVPIAGLVLGSLGAGLLIAGLPLWIRLGIWRSRARSLQTRLAALDAEADQTRHRPDPTSSRARGSSAT
jgi:uncharacterized integral membrane protein